MSWFHEIRTYPSQLNGLITCRRLLGEWSVLVNGHHESSWYIRDLWKQSLNRVPKCAGVKRILMLGLGTGSSITTLQRRFPGGRIEAIEWDPVMVQLVQELHTGAKTNALKILVGDATAIVPTLKDPYDLVLFDLYCGSSTPATAKTDSFFRFLRPLLARDGYLLLNAYRQTDLIETARLFFSHQSSWTVGVNLVASFRPFGAGTVGDPLPDGYAPFRSRFEFLTRDCRNDKQKELIGSSALPGVRRRVHGFISDRFIGDTEPVIDPAGPKRLVIWQPIRRTDTPRGWWRSPIQMNTGLSGFVDVRGSSDPTHAWSSHARRHLKQWRTRQKEWEEKPASLEVFIDAYRRCQMREAVKDLHIGILKKKATAHGSLLHLTLLQRRATGAIDAGFASLDIPELFQSIHMLSFIKDHAKKDPVGVGLVSLWFEETKQSGIRFLDFDLFRGPTDPKEWEGFSRFKAQFGVTFLRYPNPFIRLAGSWTPRKTPLL
ncbi:class I SAM-dependent methyltransferase [Candidatus Uhrbacteria bacterium]|nr:class I SAM-dependent methyltransferase [Candidatus Uhrbacteria bacterium]